jgi:PIN domain nuclease of toxin-antitoxin system
VTLLLDTYLLIWALSDPRRLAASAREAIEDPNNLVLASAACAWEIQIEAALGKLDAPDELEDQLRDHRFDELPVHVRHVRALRDLPPIHRDPFDRLLIAQTIAEKAVFVTHDDLLRSYPVKAMRA